ncbi:RCC1 isoform 12, partial [Pan troglodytes]
MGLCREEDGFVRHALGEGGLQIGEGALPGRGWVVGARGSPAVDLWEPCVLNSAAAQSVSRLFAGHLLRPSLAGLGDSSEKSRPVSLANYALEPRRRTLLDRKMSPKRIAKRRSPPADAIPKSKKVKDTRAAASRRVPGARSCQVSHRS